MSDEPPTFTTASIDLSPASRSAATASPGLVLLHSEEPTVPPAVHIPASGLLLGREAGEGLCLRGTGVSRRHAQLTRAADDVVILSDLGSTNGTMVNGVRVAEHVLRDHDVVTVGETIFRFASTGSLEFAPYRLDGTVVASLRRYDHDHTSSLLVGGYQMDSAVDRIRRVARTALSVVIFGESGTGKELAARTLHEASGRRGAFSAINCAAIPAHLVESELFGHKRGAFTGATSDRVGLIQSADEGTLFLDEIGDMPIEAQAKLLRVLQQREVLPIGANRPVPIDIRVVAATHRDLDAAVSEERFRGDLLARLREAAITLPPLRERREDLIPLCRAFLADGGRADAQLTFRFIYALAHYRWTYNVRELQSAVRLAVALAPPGAPLDAPHLPEVVRASLERRPPGVDTAPREGRVTQPAPDVAPVRKQPSEDELRQLLFEHDGNIAAVGRVLGKERMQIHRWLKRFAIDPNEYR